MNKQNELLPSSGILARRPWLPAAVFLAALMVVLAAVALLLANVSSSDYRFLPDFPDGLIPAVVAPAAKPCAASTPIVMVLFSFVCFF